MIVVTSSGWMMATRPRSSAAPWSSTPMICATSPSSHTQLVRSPTKPFGLVASIPNRSDARCQSVAAKAKEIAARIARNAASPSTRRSPSAAHRERFESSHKPDKPVDDEESPYGERRDKREHVLVPRNPQARARHQIIRPRPEDQVERDRDPHDQARNHHVPHPKPHLLSRRQSSESDRCRRQDRDEQSLGADAERKTDPERDSRRH